MFAEDLINEMIPPLKPTDSVQKALKWMEELKLHTLPVVSQEKYQGLISEEMIYAQETAHWVEDFNLQNPTIFVQSAQHFFEILRVANKYKMDMVAVVNDEGYFQGVVTISDILHAFSQLNALHEQGGILVLSLQSRDYSLTEISRLIESNGAKILSTYIAQDHLDPNRLNITLKINQNDLSRIVATLERFSYNIVATFEAIDNTDTDKNRLELLFKYLDI
ncbi:MAG TPA: cbs domain containing protein [Microscillaceae bacterium]|jgi:predicted transcriptional regulator|nr:cbs domain containing protein [Microscillaceae bacterium]